MERLARRNKKYITITMKKTTNNCLFDGKVETALCTGWCCSISTFCSCDDPDAVVCFVAVMRTGRKSGSGALCMGVRSTGAKVSVKRFTGAFMGSMMISHCSILSTDRRWVESVATVFLEEHADRTRRRKRLYHFIGFFKINERKVNTVFNKRHAP